MRVLRRKATVIDFWQNLMVRGGGGGGGGRLSRQKKIGFINE